MNTPIPNPDETQEPAGAGCMARLVMLLRSGWLPWWLRWPVMLTQVAMLPILLPVAFLCLVWDYGGPIAWKIYIDGIRNTPSEFWACWTGKCRLWDFSA